MKFKSIVLSALFINLTAVSCSTAYSEVIDLNHYSADICRQQILHSPDEYPIIMTYFHDCEFAKKFMPVYEAVAKDHPERTFYRFDYQGEWGQIILSQCLDQLGGAFSPQLRVVYLAKDPETGMVLRTPPLKMDGSGYWTKEDVVKFIDVSDKMKNISFQQTQKNPL